MRFMGGRVVTVGTFDGVHRGHMEVIRTVRALADKFGLRPLVVTFDRHPLEIVAPERAPGLIMDVDARDEILREAGMEVLRVEFTEALRRKTAAEWMRELAEEHGARRVVLGYDNTFGSDGRGMTFDDYRRTGMSLGIEVDLADAVPGCSSSAVRHAVINGDMEKSAWILGRPFTLSGVVAHGREIGRTIGVPTANVVVPDRQLLPAAGVYAASVITPAGVVCPAVVNVGRCPTVTEHGPVTVEAHILDFEGDLYGRNLKLTFLRHLRDERKFSGLDALQRQIARDIEEARQTVISNMIPM